MWVGAGWSTVQIRQGGAPYNPEGRAEPVDRRMKLRYYSTQPLLAWLINHHFYGGIHFTWAAHPFYPYRAPNPKSSSPYLMYGDFFSPWRDNDPYDRNITSMRQSLRNGVIAHRGSLHPATATFLRRLCENGSVRLFYPVVYRIDLSEIEEDRQDASQGSAALSGSHEVLIRDLREHEFDILFLEDHEDSTLQKLTHSKCSRRTAIRLLGSEC